MKKLLLISLCAMFFVGSVAAEDQISGPYQNSEGYERVDYSHTSMLLPLSGEQALLDPYSGEVWIQAHGDGTFTYRKAMHSFGNTYIKYPSSAGSPFDPNVDNITITDIWACNLEPNHAPDEIPEQTGFDPCDPEIIPMSGGSATGGRYLGFSGTTYHADVCAVRLDDLQTYLPDYNLAQFTGDGDSIVYVQQAVVAANDFTPFVFTFDYKGYVEEGDPCWVGAYDPNFPYQHSWDVNVTQWNPRVSEINDVDLESSHINPGYVQIVPPTGWEAEPVEYGRYGYKETPGAPVYSIMGEGVYTGFKVNAQEPSTDEAVVTLTNDGTRVSNYASTKVPKAKDECGDWGYAVGDVDKNCKVDFVDIAYTAQKWLACTDPDGGDCEEESSIIGIGMIFDGSDTVGPARIMDLYDDLNADVLEANDIILEYRGTQVSDGNELLGVILSMDDATAGTTISMEIERGGAQFSVNPQCELLWDGFTSATQRVPYAKCTAYELELSGRYIRGELCQCKADPDTDWCDQLLYAEPWGPPYGIVVSIGGWCEDSTGNISGNQPFRGLNKFRRLGK